MSLNAKIAALQSAHASADLAFLAAVQDARDAYVGIGEAHVAAETAWLNNPADRQLQSAAAATWAALNEARDALVAAADAANQARDAALSDAWDNVRAQALDADPQTSAVAGTAAASLSARGAAG